MKTYLVIYFADRYSTSTTTYVQASSASDAWGMVVENRPDAVLVDLYVRVPRAPLSFEGVTENA